MNLNKTPQPKPGQFDPPPAVAIDGESTGLQRDVGDFIVNWNSTFPEVDQTTIDPFNFEEGYSEALVAPQSIPGSSFSPRMPENASLNSQHQLEVQRHNESASFFKSLNNLSYSLPLSFTLSQTGPAAYNHLANAGPLLLSGHQGKVHKTNSIFSDHIFSIEYLLRQKWTSSESTFILDSDMYLDQ